MYGSLGSGARSKAKGGEVVVAWEEGGKLLEDVGVGGVGSEGAGLIGTRVVGAGVVGVGLVDASWAGV
jgi:hypothetical protein